MFEWNECNVFGGMIVNKEMFSDCSGLGSIGWVVNWSVVFVSLMYCLRQRLHSCR